jgi:tetratricopeptide (TPR) repeat protein
MASALLACGGGDKPPQTENNAAPPRLPPSMSGNAGPTDDGATAATPRDPNDEVAQGMKSLEAGDLPGAKGHFEAALKKNPKDVEAMAYLGRVSDEQGDKAAAEKRYKEALKLVPDFEPAAEDLSALYVAAAKWDDAVSVLGPALVKHNNNGALHLNLGIALAGKGEVAASTKQFDEAVRLAPKDANYLLEYAHWLVSWKQAEQAVAKLRAARALATDPKVIGAIGFEMRTAGAFADCVPTYDKAIASLDAAEFRTDRALCKLGLKDKDGALADLQAAVAKEPTNARAHYYLGGRFAEGGKLKEAIAEYETYLKLAPTGDFAKQAQERIKIMKSGKPAKK